MTTRLTGRAQPGYDFTVAVHAAEEGGYWAEVVELPGCMSQGESEEELLANIADAIAAVIDSYIEDGEELPLPDPIVRTVRITV